MEYAAVAVSVQNSFRISTDVDRTLSLSSPRVQNSFRISTDVDYMLPTGEATVQNSFRISTDVDRSEAVMPALSKTHFEFLLM